MLQKNRLSLCGLIINVLLLSACDNTPETSHSKPVVRPVKLISVSPAGDTNVSQFPAVIGANRLSKLSLQVGGKLQEFPVKEAQHLARGDLIAKLDQRDFKSAVASAQAQYQNAKEEYRRAVRLSEENAIARNVLEQRKAQYDVVKAQLDQAEKALADSVLRAPFDGIVAQTAVTNLQTILPGQVVISLMDENILKATIDLPASYIARVPKDQSENNDRHIFVLLDTAPNQPIEAEFNEATLIADTTSQTYAVSFTFTPPGRLMVLPGMNATVEIRHTNSTHATRVAVPLTAISSNGKDNFAWVVDRTTMTASKRQVTIEPGVGKMIIVTAGLTPDDTIVGAGAAYLSEGMKIREWE